MRQCGSLAASFRAIRLCADSADQPRQDCCFIGHGTVRGCWQAFAGLPVMRGNVLMLVGENPDGFRLRMLATMESIGVTLNDIRCRVWVLPQSAGLAFLLEQIKQDAQQMGDLTMVLVDTSVAFFCRRQRERQPTGLQPCTRRARAFSAAGKAGCGGELPPRFGRRKG